jgi:hypothetical protein
MQSTIAKLLLLIAALVSLSGPAARILAAPAGASGAAAPTDPNATLLLSGFEPGGPAWVKGGQAVAEHARQGTHACVLANDGKSYASLAIDDPAALRRFKDFALLRADVFNPQDRPVFFGARMDDAKSVSYGTRYNDDGCVAPPGWSTFEINLTGLTKSNARNFDQRDRLDLATLKLVSFFTGPGKPTTLYFDNVRLEGTGLPIVPGLLAFDFGPTGSPVYPGFTGCTDKMTFTPDRTFGWIAPERGWNSYMPDSLTGDFVTGGEFRVALPNGTYEVNFCMDGLGLWGLYPHYQWRKVTVNGQLVHEAKMTAEQFLQQRYFLYEDQEDLPGQDLWAKYIQPRHTMVRCQAVVADGLLRIAPTSDDSLARALMFVVVYPQAQQQAGQAWMARLQRRRAEQFNASMVVNVPKPDGEAVTQTPPEAKRGFIAFARHAQRDLAVTARPGRDELGKPIELAGAPGQRLNAQVGLFPLAKVAGVTVIVSDLTGPGGAKVPASAVRVRKVRNFLKRAGSSRLGDLLPYILQDITPLDLAPGVTRGVWLTLAVPAGTAAGDYADTVTLAAPAGARDTPIPTSAATIPLRLTVWPIKLEKIDNLPAAGKQAGLTVSVTGSTAGSWRGWYPELEPRWWKVAEQVMANQAEHGMNAVTGGPGARLKGVKDGKADIDYTDMDRWLGLAVAAGLTQAGDSYQGLDISGVPGDHSKDAVKINDEQARQKFGVSYEELLKIVYGDVEQHAKQAHWPPRAYSFLDEPRPEYQNVQSAIELTRIRTRACPQTIFSGYFSTGDGREPLFQLMPLSIAHVDDQAMALVKPAGKRIWDYSGDRCRHDIGRWAFVAAKAGMDGFLRNGYMYVCSDPYFDFSDDEGSWSVVYPSRTGLSDAVGWERTADGVDDYRYLLTCRRLIEKARKAGKAEAAATAAEAYLKETLAPIKLADKDSAALTAEGYDLFRRTLAGHIMALGKAMGE